MNQLKVHTHYGGSHCVITQGTRDMYIDARKYGPDKTHIEYVVNGRVRSSCVVRNEFAPKAIIATMYDFFK